MSAPARKQPDLMTVDEFIAWGGDGSGRKWQLFDGEPRAQDPGSDAHGTIDGNLIALIHNHLRVHHPHGRVVSQPGIAPAVQTNWNYRTPELGVSCAPNRADVHMVPAPVLLIEVLSKSNRRDTWSNVPLYMTVPSVQEILLVDSEDVQAFLLRRRPDGTWPSAHEDIPPDGSIRLESIGLELPMAEVYHHTAIWRRQEFRH